MSKRNINVATASKWFDIIGGILASRVIEHKIRFGIMPTTFGSHGELLRAKVGHT